MKLSIEKGFGFGLTSGTITTLGLMIGLHSSTHSTMVVISGILVIAIADALSDALGTHISEEAQTENTHKQVWESTVATFVSKFIFALTFVVPVLLFSLDTAMIIAIVWGIFLITGISYRLAKKHKAKPASVIFEHVAIAVFVIIATHYIGNWISLLS